MEQNYNMRSPGVKRLMREAQELCQPTEEFYAHPLEDNLFEWHFTVRGQPESDFDGGLYHGRIILPPEYPMKPPSIILLTPNGRFEVNKKICLSISGHHPESWQPCWSIRTALLAIIGFMPTPGKGAIGSLDYTPTERRLLAKKSQNWKCYVCGSIKDLLMKRTENFSAVNQEAKELAEQISFKGEADASVKDSIKTEVSPKINTESLPIGLGRSIVEVNETSTLEPLVPNHLTSITQTKTKLPVEKEETKQKIQATFPSSNCANEISSEEPKLQVTQEADFSQPNAASLHTENSLRQRLNSFPSRKEEIVKPEQKEKPVQSVNVSTVIIYAIVLVICLLVIRRLFFL